MLHALRVKRIDAKTDFVTSAAGGAGCRMRCGSMVRRGKKGAWCGAARLMVADVASLLEGAVEEGPDGLVDLAGNADVDLDPVHAEVVHGFRAHAAGEHHINIVVGHQLGQHAGGVTGVLDLLPCDDPAVFHVEEHESLALSEMRRDHIPFPCYSNFHCAITLYEFLISICEGSHKTMERGRAAPALFPNAPPHHGNGMQPFLWSTADHSSMHIEIAPVEGLPLIREGDDLPALICDRVAFDDGDILCVASSVFSKAKGYTRALASIDPGERAARIGAMCGEDPRFIQAVLDESEDILLEAPFVLSTLACGHVGVRAGVDQSNVEDGLLILLPPDPMAAAQEIRERIFGITGADVRVILTDTCGRSFRRGQTGTAIGWSGTPAIRDYRGDTDLFGHVLKITEEAVVDEIAGFANFVMGESNRGVPAVVFRNCPAWTGHDELYFTADEDITRAALKKGIQ